MAHIDPAETAGPQSGQVAMPDILTKTGIPVSRTTTTSTTNRAFFTTPLP